MNLRANKLRWVGALALLFAMAGCSDLGDPLRLVPRPVLSVASLDFGAVPVGSSASQSVSISNVGDADLNGVAALSCPEFAFESGGGSFTVPPGGLHTMVVRYSPGAVGPEGCELTLGDGLRPVTLTGTGTPAPAALCVASVSALDLGTVAVGTSVLAVFKLYSRGSLPVDVDVSAPCGELQFLGGNGAHTIPAGDSLVVTLQFTPQAGGPFSCAVSSGPGNPVVTVTGSATSISFTRDIAPIMTVRQCTICHGWSRAADLVNVVSPTYRQPLIKPFDLVNSVVYGKITNSGRYGGAMPQGTSGLPVSEREKFRVWILEGAHDN
jgi:hypothetical protein